MSVIFILLLGYLFGSIPFGYVFSKIAGKNILEIGWKKTSGSNVFKSVGFWPGLATIIGDIGKGFFTVWLARHLGFPPSIQALSGLTAIFGHNWSVFIRFAGGRGIATFIGALLALSPKIFFPSFLLFLLLALIWNTSFGTIAFLLTSIILSWKSNQLGGEVLLSTTSLFPIFLKRLSPIRELSFQKKDLIINRLLFDDDVSKFDSRFLNLIKRLTKR